MLQVQERLQGLLEGERMKYEDVMEQKKGFKVERVNIKEGTMTITVSDDWIDTVCSAVEKQIPQKVKEYEDKYYGCPVCGSVLMHKWLVAEYKEPEVDWTTVPIDTPVLVSNDGEEWERRYFSRVNCYGTVFVFSRGATSWSSDGHEAWHQYVKLAEVE